MNKFLPFILFFCSSLGSFAQEQTDCKEYISPMQLFEKKQTPYENAFSLRNYPNFELGYPAFERALSDAKAMNSSRSTNSYNLSWLTEGPYNIGGRINCIAIHPTNKNIMYVGLSDGGVFKTINKGATWFPVFDNQTKLAIGDIYIDTHNPNVVYVGTGDPNISGFPAIGDGLYRSDNGGTSWTYLGLNNDKIISKVEVHPTDSNLIYCSTMGMPFYKTTDRGLYKSTNRGSSWNKILYLSDSTGIIDFELHPTNANIIYASGWTRIRNNHEGLIQSTESAIYKSTNGGTSWNKLTNGLPIGVNSRVTIEISKQNPNKLYALFVDTFLDVGGIFKTIDAGATWTTCALNSLPNPVQGNFGWYFDGLKINPYNDNEIFVLGVDLYKSTDGGDNFNSFCPPWWMYDVHADKHDLVFSSTDSIYLATDGGLYRTIDNGTTWTDEDYIPNTEFYHIAVSPHVAKLYAGGAQDNGTSWGTSTDINWPRVYGGDGFNVQFVASDPDIVYAETQNGNINSSTNGGINFNDISVTTGDRTNWDQPYIISQHNNAIMYTGTYRIYKNTIAPNQNWTPISSDLTDGIVYEPRFHNITTIAESPFTAGLLYVGTSDGNVWRSDNDGGTWVNITGTLPNRYITRVVPSKTDVNTVFVCNSGYKEGDNIPHIHVSHDKGLTWTNISGNLPQLGINDVETVSLTDSLLFVANDGGIYYTMDYGTDWKRLGNNMPFIWVYDIEVDVPNNRLVAGTFARSIQSIDIDSITNYYTTVIANATSSDDTICNGQTTTLNASGGTSYSWTPTTGLTCSTCASTTATPSSNTTYIVQVSAGAAVAFDTVQIVVHPSPVAPIITVHRDTLFASGAGPFTWYRNGISISGANQNFIVTSVAGSYIASVSNAAGCNKNSNAFLFTGFSNVGIDDVISQQLLIYPIYSSEELKIIFEADNNRDASIQLYDMQGALIKEQHFTNTRIGKNEENISIANLSNGIYIYSLKIGEKTHNGKLVVGW